MPYCAKLPDIIPHYPSEKFQPTTVPRNSAQPNDAETANKRQKNLNKLREAKVADERCDHDGRLLRRRDDDYYVLMREIAPRSVSEDGHQLPLPAYSTGTLNIIKDSKMHTSKTERICQK